MMAPLPLLLLLLLSGGLVVALLPPPSCPRPRFPLPPPACGCSVSRRHPVLTSGASARAKPAPAPAPVHGEALADMALIPGGTWRLGTDSPVLPADGEGPARTVTLPAFHIDRFEVSRRQFSEFVARTGHVTEAEAFGTSFVLRAMVPGPVLRRLDLAVAAAPWWVPVPGANWSRPVGGRARPVSSAEWRQPAVHVSWSDAAAFCRWRSKRLPSEAEWEAACRGGLRDRLYPWGNKERPRGAHRMNIWQGHFPDHDAGEDGHAGLAPVDSMDPQNRFGLHHMVGNVWEWTADWWDAAARADRVKKGGSFMCHRSYCFRYRCAARGRNTPDTSALNVGFRCAADA